MTEPELIPAAHDHPDGPALGWAAADFGPADYAGDADTDALPLVANGTQSDTDDAQQ